MLRIWEEERYLDKYGNDEKGTGLKADRASEERDVYKRQVPATVKSILYEIFLCKRKHSRKKQPAGAVKIHQLPETRASEFFLPYKFKLGL